MNYRTYGAKISVALQIPTAVLLFLELMHREVKRKPFIFSKLELYYRIQINQSHAIYRHQEVFLHCWLSNIGPATAQEVFVFCEPPPGIPTPDYDHRFWREAQSARPGHALVFERSVHPEELINICSFRVGNIDEKGSPRFSADKFTFRFHISVRD